MRNLLVKLFGHRYYRLDINNKSIELRVDIFGKAQYRKYYPYGWLPGIENNYVWTNIPELNTKSKWVKENK